jgi:hypothetical protein
VYANPTGKGFSAKSTTPQRGSFVRNGQPQFARGTMHHSDGGFDIFSG